ncbi:putative ROK1-ATP-dependent RNA helicase [Serendipita vermifera]|nr:putative ROK1-ATP-dependent RNA helicase [Serendipita vermifera]
MEAFQLLSRGGSFNKNRFKADVKLFSASKDKNDVHFPTGSELPPSLDFFKYAKKSHSGDHSSQATGLKQRENEDTERQSRKRKRDESVEDEMDIDSDPESRPLKHRVTTKGQRVPAATDSFEEMEKRFSLPVYLMQNIRSLGYKEPTAIQRTGVSILAEGRDLAAISPTGTGKTLAYLLPLFSRLGAPLAKSTPASKGGVRALVLAPTRELAGQIYNEAQKLAQGRKWRIILFSKASASTLKDPAVREKVDIIISTPLRLVASIQAEELQLDKLSKLEYCFLIYLYSSSVRFLVLDEADRLLDTEFVSQVEEIVALCSHEECQKAVFSATLPAKAEQIALGMLKDPIRVVVGLKDTPLPNITQSLVYVAQPESKLPTLLQYLTSPAGYTPPLIVFTSTQARSTSLHSELLLAGVRNVDVLHAGMTKHERDQCVRRMLQGEVWVLVTTDVLARGMDFGGVRGVINFDWPESVQSYVHRIGRTGRAGRQGVAITYFTDEDAPFLKSIANVLLQSGQTVPEWMVKLPKASRLKRKQMGKAQHRITSVGPKGENVGRALALKKRDMIAASKRRKARQEEGGESEDEAPA